MAKASGCISLNYQLIRSSKRKSIAIQVRDAQVIVRAPAMVDEDYINKLLTDKASWLRAKIRQQMQQPVHSLLSAPILITGDFYQLKLSFGEKSISLDNNNNQLQVTLAKRFADAQQDKIEQQLGKMLLEWFKLSLQQYLDRRVPELMQLTGLVPSKIQVRKYRARWGSCNSRKELSFNSLLWQAPDWVVDYVILHELCHLKYMNHSTKFWQLLANYCQEVQPAKRWLQQHQYQFLSC